MNIEGEQSPSIGSQLNEYNQKLYEMSKIQMIKNLIHELVDIEIDIKNTMNKIPSIDMEKYEDSEVEDLVNEHYLYGKLSIVEEFKDYLETLI